MRYFLQIMLIAPPRPCATAESNSNVPSQCQKSEKMKVSTSSMIYLFRIVRTKYIQLLCNALHFSLLCCRGYHVSDELLAYLRES